MSYEVHSRNVGLSVQSIELDERHPEKQAINSIAKNFATKFFAILKYLNNRHLLCKKRNINTAFRISYFVFRIIPCMRHGRCSRRCHLGCDAPAR